MQRVTSETPIVEDDNSTVHLLDNDSNHEHEYEHDNDNDNDNDNVSVSTSTTCSIILDNAPQPPFVGKITKTSRPREKAGANKMRSSLVRSLRGSVYLANNFPLTILPAPLRSLQIYTVIERVEGEAVENNPTVPYDSLEHHYVVKRLVDTIVEVSAKTIENYFKKKDVNTQIGYVVHSNRFPTNTRDFLSPSNEYMLIRLDWLRDWYVHSLKIRKSIQTGRGERWPVVIAPPAPDGKKRRLEYENEVVETIPVFQPFVREKEITQKEKAANNVLSKATLDRIEKNRQLAIERRRIKKANTSSVLASASAAAAVLQQVTETENIKQ